MLVQGTGSGVTLQFQRDVCSYFHSLFVEGRFSDVTIVVDDRSFQAHKLILATQSAFFEAMFYNPSMLESSTEQVHLKETDADIFAHLLRISYGGCLPNADSLDPDTLIRLFILFERYQFVKYEQTLLFEVAHKLLTPNNFWNFLDVSVYYNVTQFIDLCLEFFEMLGKSDKKSSNKKLEDKASLFSNENFLKISHETLKFMLDRNLNCPELLLLK